MSIDKTIEKLLRSESDANIRFDELCHIFTRRGVIERINIQREGSKAKPYQVRQVRKILAQYKLL
jgi:hypothetical protein